MRLAFAKDSFTLSLHSTRADGHDGVGGWTVGFAVIRRGIANQCKGSPRRSLRRLLLHDAKQGHVLVAAVAASSEFQRLPHSAKVVRGGVGS